MSPRKRKPEPQAPPKVVSLSARNAARRLGGQIAAPAKKKPRSRAGQGQVQVQSGVEVTRDYDFLPGEVAVALEAALQTLGVEAVEIPTVISMFGSAIQIPFKRQEIKTPAGESISLGIGTYSIKAIGEIRLDAQTDLTEGRLVVRPKLSGWDEDLWEKIGDKVEELLPSIRLFRGQPFKVKRPADLYIPRYIQIDKDVKMILNDRVSHLLDVGLFRFIEHHAALKAAGLRVKRGVLMHGHYGTGKTSVAYNTAKLAARHGMAFISITGNMAEVGFQVCKTLGPAVMFVEDLDEVTHGDRDRLNSLLNTISSIESKECDVIIVTSTNFIERIDPAFLRPDRFDTLVQMELPDTGTIARLMDAYGGDRLHLTRPEMERACEVLTGCTPAIIAEILGLASVVSITEGRKIVLDDITFFAQTMERQKGLAVPRFESGRSSDQLARGLRGVLNERDEEF